MMNQIDPAGKPIVPKRIVAKIVCRRCGYSWVPRAYNAILFRKRTEGSRCPGCRSRAWDRTEEDILSRCHPKCRGRVCRFDALEWLVARQLWRPVPFGNHIRWEIADPVPATVNDIMLTFYRNRLGRTTRSAKVNSDDVLRHLRMEGYVVRRKKSTKTNPKLLEGRELEVNSHGQVCGRYIGKCKYQFLPTSKAMSLFLTRNPKEVSMEKSGNTIQFVCGMVEHRRIPGSPKVVKFVVTQDEMDRISRMVGQPAHPWLIGKTGTIRKVQNPGIRGGEAP